MTDKTLHEALEGLRFAMVATADAGGTWKSRPLTLAGHEPSRLSFLVSVDVDWVAALVAGDAPMLVTFSDQRRNTYVSLEGSGRVSDDRARIADLWNPGAAAYFHGKDDPQVRVLDLDVEQGEFWDGPDGRFGALLQLASAALGHESGDQGAIVD